MSDDELVLRFSYHPAVKIETKNDHANIRETALELARFINETVPEGREKSLAITKLEEVMMWCNAGIARNSA